MLTSELGANILLAYFHYCNRGTYPFSDECKESDLQNLAELDCGAIDFVRWTRKLSNSHSKSDSTPHPCPRPLDFGPDRAGGDYIS